MPGRGWTTDEDALLVELYSTTPIAVLSEKFGRSVSAIHNRAGGKNLKRSSEFWMQVAKNREPTEAQQSRMFKGGDSPWNKGKKGCNGFSETRFKPGSVSGRAAQIEKPIFSERINKDGNREFKISTDLPGKKKWKTAHQLIWERMNGRELPKGSFVIFRDRNSNNLNCANVELVTRAQNMARNSYHNNYPKEIQLAIQLRGALSRQINQRTAK